METLNVFSKLAESSVLRSGLLNITDKYKFRSPILEVLEQQQTLFKRFEFNHSLYTNFERSLDKALLNIPNLDVLGKLAESLNFRNYFKISDSIVEAIEKINIQQNQFAKIFGQINIVNRIGFPNQSYLKGFNDIFSNITKDVTVEAIVKENWEVVSDVEHLRSVLISELDEVDIDVFRLNAVSGDKEQVVLETLLELWNKYKKTGGKIVHFLNVIVLFMGIHQYVDFLKPKQDAVTKADLIDYNAKFEKYLQINQPRIGGFRELNVKCKVYLKPSSNSYVIDTISEIVKVVPLEIHHKWIYVSFQSPKDGITISGWILKKYVKCL